MILIKIVFGKIYRGFRFIIEEILLIKLYELSYRISAPSLSAIILSLKAKPLNKGKKYRVLCLGRSIFDSDVMALVEYGKDIQYLRFHKHLVGKIVRYFIPEIDLKNQLNKKINTSLIPGYQQSDKREDIGTEYGVTYHVDPTFEKGKEKLYNYLLKMIPILKKFLKFDAVMSGNYVYADQQEFIKICEENNIPIIILYKEGLPHYWFDQSVTPGQTACKFIGSRILFVNDSSKKHELKYLPGLEEKHSITVGVPRYDHYINNKIKVNEKQITFFAFALKEHVRRWHDMELEKANRISEISEKFVKNIIDFSIKNDDYIVFIKLKGPGEYYRKLIDTVLYKHFNGVNSPNLIITSSESSERLVMSSEVIISYNCGILFEAVLCDKTIICPDFKNLDFGDYFESYPGIVNYTNDYKEMENIIFNYHNYKGKNLFNKEDFLKKSMFAMDGKSSLRAEEAIIDAIDERG